MLTVVSRYMENKSILDKMVLLKMVDGKESFPDPLVQRQLISKYVTQSMSIGQHWYLIDINWYKNFKQYVGLEDTLTMTADHPGPIDNSALFSEDQPGDLKEHLLDQLDYVLVPEEAWKLLAEWYGVVSDKTAIRRRVVEYGIFVKYCKVEVYPVQLLLCKDFDYNNELNYNFSIADPIRKIENVMRKLFEIPNNVNTRLWSCFSTNTYDLLTKPNSSIQDEGIFQNQLIVIETRKEDGTWRRPTNIVSTSAQSTAGTSSESKDNGGFYAERYPKAPSTSRPEPANSPAKRETKIHCVTRPGLCGLSNLGNTCFMNSVIQCMSNCPPITNYFLRDDHLKELNVRNPLGMRGEIAKAFANLIKVLWSGKHTYTVPHQFKLQVGKFAPQFCGYQQHDAQELLTFLLDGLHEDLNRVKDKPYIETRHDSGRTDEEMAAEAWKNYMKRNDSVIVDFFHGLLKSTVICPDCNTISITFDPFCYLSLPLPTMKDRHIQILLFPLTEELNPLKYTLELPNNGTVQDLVHRLAVLRGANPRCFIATEVINHHFHKIFTNEEPLESINDRDCIYVYEIPMNYEPHIILPIYMWESNEKNLNANRLFGYPLLISVSKNNCTYSMLYDIIWKKIHQYHSTTVSLEEILTTEYPRREGLSLYEVEECEGDIPRSEYVFSLFLINRTSVKADVIRIHNDNKPIQFPEMAGSSYIAAKWYPRDVKRFGFDSDFTEVVAKTKSRQNEILHLTDCLKLYTASEMLSANDAWYCPNCKKHQLATKKFDLWRLPKILIMHLKRFSYSVLHREKIDTMVEFPLKDLDMSEFIIDKNHPKVTYDLIGVCNHYGRMGSGHYTAFCQNKLDKRWYLFDDIKVTSVKEDEVLSHSAYVLFYMQRDENLPPT